MLVTPWTRSGWGSSSRGHSERFTGIRPGSVARFLHGDRPKAIGQHEYECGPNSYILRDLSLNATKFTLIRSFRSGTCQRFRGRCCLLRQPTKCLTHSATTASPRWRSPRSVNSSRIYSLSKENRPRSYCRILSIVTAK